VSVSSIDIYRIVDGQIVEQGFEADLTGMLHQLGLVHTSGHLAAASAAGAGIRTAT